MTTTTVNTIIPEFADSIGAYVGAFSTTTAVGGTGSLTTVISTGLRDIGFTDDDVLNDFFIRITSGNNDDVIRRISDYTGSSGAITITGTDLTGDGSTGTTFEIYRYDPNQLINALNSATRRAFPALYKVVHDRTLTTSYQQYRYTRPSSIMPRYIRQVYLIPKFDVKTYSENILNDLNCDFEESTSSVPDDWVDSANITDAIENDTTDPNNNMVYRGNSSAKLTCAATSTGTYTLSASSPTNYESEELNFSIWVYSKHASLVSAMIQIDSDTATTGTAHSGGGWERLTVSATASNVGSTIKVGLSFASNSAIYTVYADEAILTSGASESPLGSEVRVYDWREEGDYFRFLGTPNSLYQIHVVGAAQLETLDTTGTTTITLEPHQRDLLYSYGAERFFEGELDQTSYEDQTSILRTIQHYRNRRLEGVGEMILPPLVQGVTS